MDPVRNRELTGIASEVADVRRELLPTFADEVWREGELPREGDGCGVGPSDVCGGVGEGCGGT